MGRRSHHRCLSADLPEDDDPLRRRLDTALASSDTATDPLPETTAVGPGRAWLRSGLLLVLIAASAVALVVVDLPSPASARDWLSAGGAERWLAAVAALSLALLTPLSRTALSVLVGAVAGFTAGLAIAITAGMVAGATGFWLSRRLGRAAVAHWVGDPLAVVDRWLHDRDLVAVLTARLMPVAPFAVVTYAAGLSSVRFRPYLVGTAIGLVPWSVLYVGMGASAVSIGTWAGQLDRLLLVAVAATALVVLGRLLWRRRRHSTQTPARDHQASLGLSRSPTADESH